ncbi:YpjP family protein [Priestia koreensis]|uniref:YpjP family protein n=1 Tax=Priestia koreensis TaxID=284581 RepID=UPI003457891B
MPKWMRKTLIVLITVCTFGLVTPPEYLYIDEAEASNTNHKENYVQEASPDELAYYYNETPQEETETPEAFVTNAMQSIEAQSVEKFGTKIGPKIDDQFRAQVLPQIEQTLTAFVEQYPHLNNLEISEHPAGGYGEKIFHVYDRETGQDLIRFHVRRDHPPKEGYWFNFHYHMADDQFQKHYDLAKIYWNNNEPPKWYS